MIVDRQLHQAIKDALRRQAAVVLIGPRQVGKTTLAYKFVKDSNALYLDLETKADRDKVSTDPALFLSAYEDRLVILDEVHRAPELFQELRGLIDKGRRRGIRSNRFLILGSASLDLMRQSGESLAGRVEYIELYPLNLQEVSAHKKSIQNLWIRGGFPDSFLAKNNADSFVFRQNFIRTYLERDIPQFGHQRIPSTTLERLWTMLAHSQGTLLNASKLASALSLTQPTVTKYIDLLVELMLVRRLPPLIKNTKKRLIKTPKVYVRDSGLLHALLGLQNHNELSGHPILGMSWEGFVIEQLLSVVPNRTMASFYSTSAGAEIDFVLEFLNKKELWAIEIKHSLSATPQKGFYNACDDLKPTRSFVVYSGKEDYPIKPNIKAISLSSILQLLKSL